MRDDDGNRIQKRVRYYTETDTDMYQIWTFDNGNLLTRLRLSQGKPLTHKDTFTKYRPSHIKHIDFLSLFACDICIPFDYLLQATTDALKRSHVCKTANCPNYMIPMGSVCNCEHCNECIIDEITSIPAQCLLNNICCDNDQNIVPWLECIKGDCWNNCRNKYSDLVLNNTGCHTLNIYDESMIRYKVISDFPIGDDKKQKRKCVTFKQLQWKNFRVHFASKYEEYIYHLYAKNWQFQQREIVSSKINNTVILPEDILFASIDFIANVPLRSRTTTHGSLTKIATVQLCVIYDVCNVNNVLDKSAFTFLSDVTSHGWYSAVPVMRKYIQKRKEDFRRRNVNLKTIILWSDRGPTDFWTSPFVMYTADVCIRNNLNLNISTTAVGHGKWMHDQIGGVIKKIIVYLFKHGYINLTESGSIAACIVSYMNSNYRYSADRTITRYFLLLTPQEIRVANSQVPTIKGIKSYHNIHIDINKNIKMREFSCHCAMCLLSDFTSCTKDMYCNEWHSVKYDAKYPSYNDMTLRNDIHALMSDSNHNVS